jgi:hypothetical protein
MTPDIFTHHQTPQLDLKPTLVPEFIRLPRSPDRCPFSGLSRSALNELILGANPPVKSVVMRKRGAVRGVRLIDYGSLVSYLHQLGADNATRNAAVEGGQS